MSKITDLIGKPFKDGGRGPDSFDCWGLAIEVFRRHGIELPDFEIGCHESELINAEYHKQVGQWLKVTNPPVPSLVVIRFNEAAFFNHVGSYIGNGRFIHITEKAGANIDRVDHPYWRTNIAGFYIPRWVKDERYQSYQA